MPEKNHAMKPMKIIAAGGLLASRMPPWYIIRASKKQELSIAECEKQE